MLKSVKSFFSRFFWRPLSIVLSPITKRLAVWLEPLGSSLESYKNATDERWASFAVDNPRLAVWLRRGGKLGLFFYAIYFVFAIGIFGEIPTVEELREMQTLNTSEVYTQDGVLIGKFYKENRKDISFAELPQNLVDALVSTEDERYWEHSGVDMQAILRVLWRSVIMQDRSGGGGSTISQQLAKNLFGRTSYWLPGVSTPINKVREMLIARRLESAFDKKELLAFYLNTVPFGGNVFGVEMASQRFFSKSARNLKVEESAVIVGMLKANTTYNPKRNYEKSRDRRNVVMFQMVNTGKLSRKTYDALKDDSIHLKYQVILSKDSMGSYFKDYLRQTLPKMLEPFKKADGTAYDIYKDGLKIYTSIDATMQTLAEQAVTKRMAELQKQFDGHWSSGKWWGEDRFLMDEVKKSPHFKMRMKEVKNETRVLKEFETQKVLMNIFAWENGEPSEKEVSITRLDSVKYYLKQLNAGFMVLDPKSGFVKAWVGGTNFDFFQYDHVTSRRQVGSTFKPIVYAQALKSGIRPCEYISNELMTYLNNGRVVPAYDISEAERESGWTPHNSDGSYMGSYSLEGALTNSVNVVSAQLIKRVGFQSVQKLAKDMGVTSKMQDDMSIALGTADISLLDMMKVYGTFATRGKRPEPVSVLKITDRDGKVIADFEQAVSPRSWQQVLTELEADMMTKMMESVVEDGTAGRIRYKYNIESDIAGKTGTTQNQSDGWFMSFTPNLVCGAWVGGQIPAVRFRDMSLGQGAHMALPITGLFLQELYKNPRYADLAKEKFPEHSKYIRDSMSCDPHIYSDDELLQLDSMRLQDSLENLGIFPTPQDVPNANPSDNDEDGLNTVPKDDHSLRPTTPKPATPPANKPAGTPAATPNKPPTTTPSNRPNGTTPPQKPNNNAPRGR